jgi:hypothetical protein
MKKDSKEIGILKKITTYKKIIKYENDGLSHSEIAKKINLGSSEDIQKIIIWGKTYFRESELLEFNKLSPKASSLLSSNKSINLYEKSLPENETKLLNLDKLDFFKLPKERIVYLNKLSKALKSGNYAKLKLRHLVYFHNKWIDLIINNSEKVKIPYDKYQDSWLFLVAGLDTCSKIFIDKKISIMFMDLKNHILNSKPWYNVESNNNYKGPLRSLINKLFFKPFKISDNEFINGNKRVEEYILNATNYSNKIRVYLDNLTRELNQYSIIDFKKNLKNIIPMPDSLSKKQFVKTKYMEIDVLRFFCVEILNLSVYNCYRLISVDVLNINEKDFIENYIPKKNEIISSDYSNYVNYYLWCRKQTIKEYEKLVDYEKKGKRGSADKIIQVNALGDLIDDINGDLDII